MLFLPATLLPVRASMEPALELDESDELSPLPCGVIMVTPSSNSLTSLGVSRTVPPTFSNGIGGGAILLSDGVREGAAGVGGVDGCGGGVCWPRLLTVRTALTEGKEDSHANH